MRDSYGTLWYVDSPDGDRQYRPTPPRLTRGKIRIIPGNLSRSPANIG